MNDQELDELKAYQKHLKNTVVALLKPLVVAVNAGVLGQQLAHKTALQYRYGILKLTADDEYHLYKRFTKQKGVDPAKFEKWRRLKDE